MGNVRSDFKCFESVGADSFWVHLYPSQRLWVRMLYVSVHVLRVVLCSSPSLCICLRAQTL